MEICIILAGLAGSLTAATFGIAGFREGMAGDYGIKTRLALMPAFVLFATGGAVGTFWFLTKLSLQI